MSKMQRDKGKRIEREACDMAGRCGFEARRARQSDGKLDADLVFPGHPNWYAEVKGVRGVLAHHQTADDWIAKANEDARQAGMDRPFVWLKIHGTRNWGMGWADLGLGVHCWVFGEARIAHVLRGWSK